MLESSNGELGRNVGVCWIRQLCKADWLTAAITIPKDAMRYATVYNFTKKKPIIPVKIAYSFNIRSEHVL
jgi:hypothetical protein